MVYESSLIVTKSWKIKVDCPYFWMKKCVQKGMPKNLHVAWTELLQRIVEGSILELEARECLMKLYGVYHFGKLYHRGIYHEWKQSYLDGINVIHIPITSCPWIYQHCEVYGFLRRQS